MHIYRNKDGSIDWVTVAGVAFCAFLGGGSALFIALDYSQNHGSAVAGSAQAVVVSTHDCDDTNPTTNVGAVEFCDGVDNNCDGAVDNDCTFCIDMDGDGHCADPVLLE